MSEDAYVRLSRDGARYWGQPAGPGNLLFIDLAPGATLGQMRTLPYALFREVSRVLFRARGGYRRRGGRLERMPVSISNALRHSLGQFAPPPQSRTRTYLEVDRYLSREAARPPFAVLHQPLGEEPWIETAESWEDDYLARARAIELEALLRWGAGIWTPEEYHYLLPSGEHAEGFVRTANAIRTPRDAEVLASWLRRHARNGLGIVLDTGTLTPIALALHGAMRERSLEVGPVEVLDRYPATGFDVFRALREAQRQNAVLALLSVSSSGRVRDYLIDAMRTLETESKPARALRAIEVLVDKRETAAHEEAVGKARLTTWHPRPGGRPLVSRGTDYAEGCPRCQENQLLVPISPDSFEGTFPASVELLTPSVSDADRNRRLWEACNQYEAIQLDAPPKPGLEHLRSTGTMSVRVDLDGLVSAGSFRETAAAALKERLKGAAPPVRADTILVLDEEDSAEVDELIEMLAPLLGHDALTKAVFPRDEEWPRSTVQAVEQASGIAVLALGTVTGTSLQRALVGAQRHRQPGDGIAGLVLHARLSDRRAWETLENSYANRLYCAFHSYLPLRSPLADEASLLDNKAGDIEAKLTGATEKFFAARGEYCANPVDRADIALFWGSTPETTVTPNSIYGEGLRGPAVYAAVASAMERRRQAAEAKAAPTRHVFDMEAIVRSYYDPLILSAILRWLTPAEKWWGRELHRASVIVDALLKRSGDDALILVPELLLAAAQGKLPPAAITAARSHARRLLDRDLTDDQRAPIELGLMLAPVLSEPSQAARA